VSGWLELSAMPESILTGWLMVLGLATTHLVAAADGKNDWIIVSSERGERERERRRDRE
jgi:hypothetical protein